MSWIDHIVERQIADAIARDELEPAHLRGTPLDLDSNRGDGWWAEQLVRKERSRLLLDDAVPERARRQAAFWRAGSIEDLLSLVTDANKWVVDTNLRLVPADALALFDPREAIDTWRSLAR
jgi:hypothetical protein